MNRGSFMQPETQTHREGEEGGEEGVGSACVRGRALKKKGEGGGVNAQAHWFENDNVKACP